MNDETFHQSIRKFLRAVGVQSQQEIERAVTTLRASGAIQGNERFPATMTLDVAGLRLNVKFDGSIDLE
jgi:SOS-response transcriptional repressor LexA